MQDFQSWVYLGLSLAIGLYVVKWRMHPLRAIPTVGGPSAPLLSYLTAFRMLFRSAEILAEGYQKHYGSAFKVAFFDQWMVMVTGPKMVEDLRRRPDHELSFGEAADDALQMKHTLGRDTLDDPYHVGIVRDKLTRGLPALFPALADEVMQAVADHIPAADNEWVAVDTVNVMQKIVARASNRVFVGLPLCRDDDYVDLAINFTLDVMKDKYLINMFPPFLKSVVGALYSRATSTRDRCVSMLKPMIDERKAKMAEYADSEWPEKPADLLQWVLDEAVPRQSPDALVAERILIINFGAIHTSSNSVTHALYDLAAAPQYIAPLRAEIEAVVAAEGWTKAAIGKMWKLDSTLKESQRYNGINIISVIRKAMQDVTLCDGTRLPKGTLVGAPSRATHRDEAHYADPDAFDAFRFARLRGRAAAGAGAGAGVGEGARHQMVHTSVDYVPFGHGRHACPGRFFAASELKTLLAFLILNYDFKFAGDGARPPNLHIAEAIIPNPSARLMFRKRQDVAYR